MTEEVFEAEPENYDASPEIRGPSEDFGAATAQLHKTIQRLSTLVVILMVMVLVVVAGTGALWSKIVSTEATVHRNCISRTAAVKTVAGTLLKPYDQIPTATPEQVAQSQFVNAQKLARNKALYGKNGSLTDLKC